MIKSLRESKAKLSELVDRASQGEDVLITVRGKIKARLTRAPEPTDNADMQRWAGELGELQERTATGRHTLSAETILGDDRENRV